MSTSHLVIDPAIRCEIEALIVEHSWMLDNHKSDGLGELYVEDGRLTGIGPDRIGRAAIEAYGRDRAKMAVRKARHVNTNIRLVKDGPATPWVPRIRSRLPMPRTFSCTATMAGGGSKSGAWF